MNKNLPVYGSKLQNHCISILEVSGLARVLNQNKIIICELFSDSSLVMIFNVETL